jgi:HK97 family phage major capsid protein
MLKMLLPVFKRTPETGSRLRGRVERIFAWSYVGENTSLGQTNFTFDLLTLTARKLVALVLLSADLAEDAEANFVAQVTDMIAQEFARQIDAAAFIGDGTSTYGGQTGLCSAIIDGNHAAAKFTAAHNTYATLDGSDATSLVGRSPKDSIRTLPGRGQQEACSLITSEIVI